MAMKLLPLLEGFNARLCTLPRQFAEKRAEFWKQENLRDSKIDLNSLSEDEKEIYWAHKEAIQKGHFTYNDPKTERKIWTTYNHFLKGKCCGEACRHCIYDYEGVPNEIKEDRFFNGIFWADSDQERRDKLSYIKKIFNIIKIKPK